ncbi:type III polyketide synthase [Niabella sp. 22666]|uniref:type III polyketide synthase n=1 Tax=Niabella sp. 22666 TaxID=3453954 RepID=UPI003F869A14
MSKITSIATAVPVYQQSQMQIYDAVRAVHAGTEEEARVLRFMYKSSGIETRYAAVPDFNLENGRNEILHVTGADINTSGLEDRLKIYDKAALDLSIDVIRKCLHEDMNSSDITHLITVSCTGMQAPGLDLSIVKELKLCPNIYRTSVNFMGCYAAIHGLKHAHYIAEKEPDAKVLVVCVELCTLHFQKDRSIDNITSTIIFGDGAAAVLVENSGSKRAGWELKKFYSEINFEGIDDMAWKISKDGFLMTLTNKVPEILEKKCKDIMDHALQYYGITSEAVDSWCVHPGGKKILEAVERGSSVTREQLQESYAVLKEYGNMSSPTVLFVLEKILRRAEQNGSVKNIVGMAFGPGLTLETFHLAHA